MGIIDSRGALATLREQIHEEKVVKGIDDLHVGDIVYYDMDRADGIERKWLCR